MKSESLERRSQTLWAIMQGKGTGHGSHPEYLTAADELEDHSIRRANNESVPKKGWANIRADWRNTPVNPTGKECQSCGAFKPYDDFGRDASRGDGRDFRCRSCRAIAEGRGQKGAYGPRERSMLPEKPEGLCLIADCRRKSMPGDHVCEDHAAHFRRRMDCRAENGPGVQNEIESLLSLSLLTVEVMLPLPEAERAALAAEIEEWEREWEDGR